jgi:hypothetical protein
MLIPYLTFFHPDPGSEFFFHPGFEFFLSKIPDPYFKTKILCISSRKYDPSCLSRIRILIFYPSRILDQWIKKAPDPGFGSATLDVRLQPTNHLGTSFRCALLQCRLFKTELCIVCWPITFLALLLFN